MLKKIFLSLIVMLAFVSSGYGNEKEDLYKRDSWYIGFGLGGGSSPSWKENGKNVTLKDITSPGNEDKPRAINFKLGTTIDPNTLLGLDITAINQKAEVGMSFLGSVDFGVQITNVFGMVTYFPQKKGLFFRGGGGLSSINYTFMGINGQSTNGYGGSLGMGYAFWVGKNFNLTLNMDYSYQLYKNEANKPRNSQFGIFYLGFDWY